MKIRTNKFVLLAVITLVVIASSFLVASLPIIYLVILFILHLPFRLPFYQTVSILVVLEFAVLWPILFKSWKLNVTAPKKHLLVVLEAGALSLLSPVIWSLAIRLFFAFARVIGMYFFEIGPVWAPFVIVFGLDIMWIVTMLILRRINSQIRILLTYFVLILSAFFIGIFFFPISTGWKTLVVVFGFDITWIVMMLILRRINPHIRILLTYLLLVLSVSFVTCALWVRAWENVH